MSMSAKQKPVDAAERLPARSASEDGQPHGEDSQGTPFCNTVPSNDNDEHFKPLRFGIDSLYLSYHGQLSATWDTKLNDLKSLAQSDDEAEQALAQVVIESHIFEVRDQEAPRFPFVLADNCFFIKINRKQYKTLPMAHVQISSEYLSSVGVEAAEKDLSAIIHSLGRLKVLPVSAVLICSLISSVAQTWQT